MSSSTSDASFLTAYTTATTGGGAARSPDSVRSQNTVLAPIADTDGVPPVPPLPPLPPLPPMHAAAAAAVLPPPMTTINTDPSLPPLDRGRSASTDTAFELPAASTAAAPITVEPLHHQHLPPPPQHLPANWHPRIFGPAVPPLGPTPTTSMHSMQLPPPRLRPSTAATPTSGNPIPRAARAPVRSVSPPPGHARRRRSAQYDHHPPPPRSSRASASGTAESDIESDASGPVRLPRRPRESSSAAGAPARSRREPSAASASSHLRQRQPASRQRRGGARTPSGSTRGGARRRPTAVSQYETTLDDFSSNVSDDEGTGDDDHADLAVHSHRTGYYSTNDEEEEEEEWSDHEPMTVRERQALINAEHPFGLRLWKPALYKKRRGIDVATEQELRSTHSPFLGPSAMASPPMSPTSWGGLRTRPASMHAPEPSLLSDHDDVGDGAHPLPPPALGWWSVLTPGNLVWAALFSVPLALALTLAALTVAVASLGTAHAYARALLRMALYWAWPFGRELHVLHRAPAPRTRCCCSPGLALHRLVLAVVAGPVLFTAAAASWLAVVYLPMAKAVGIAAAQLWRDPLALVVDHVELAEPVPAVAGARPGEDLAALMQHVHFGASLAEPARTPAGIAISVVDSADEAVSDTDDARAPLLGPRTAPAAAAGSPATLLLCVCRAGGLRYLKYTVDGTNILFVNLIPFVVWVLVDGYLLGQAIANPRLLFGMCLLATIPLSYFIGMAVASVSAQSSPAIGAVLNASFGSVIEVILYCLALREGKTELVEGAVIGTFLGVLLLLPGVSMIAGGLRRKQQAFNAKSAGVTNTMLIMALIGTFTPTLFYQIFGSFDLACAQCTDQYCSNCTTVSRPLASDAVYLSAVVPLSYICAIILPLVYVIGLVFSLKTHKKHIYHPPAAATTTTGGVHATTTAPASAVGTPASLRPAAMPSPSPFTMLPAAGNRLARPLHHAPPPLGSPATAATQYPTGQLHATPVASAVSVASVSARPPSIVVGRTVSASTLGTRRPPAAAPPAASTSGGHDAPEWSRRTSMLVLVACTISFALIAELLVGTVEVVLDDFPIPEKFLGLTLLALVPSLTEFVNAIAFAVQGNIALSLEIGSAYAVQVALVQIPLLVGFCSFDGAVRRANDVFTLIFPQFDMTAVMFAVFLLSFVYHEGKSNYFKGSMLTLAYVVLLAAFFFATRLPVHNSGRPVVHSQAQAMRATEWTHFET
ncbi:hypothetical protein H9P43_009211 [Blastocladiella emersonii ATCC 22665]|nr:hypothetical protein H9P43_009211 [Blastocladiella emersonii ATCC 22665]